MTAPINQEFVSGTTITSQWLNGVNDAINNSTQDIPGSEARTLLDKLSDVVSIKDFGAVGDGVTNDTAAIQAASQSGRLVEFTPGIYYLSQSSLAALPNGRISLASGTRFFAKDPDACVIKTTYAANPLIYTNQANSCVSGIGFDFTGSTGASRCIKADAGADGFKAKRLRIKGMTSATFIQAIAVDDSVAGFVLDDIEFFDLYAAPNSTVGDLNGSCRGIYVGGDGVAPAALGHGRIRKIYGENVQTVEDADLIHIQTAATGLFNVKINDVKGRNVAKRLVKIQANGVKCRDVHADAVSNATPMYAVVSAYGNDCTVSDVSGSGQIKIGVDMSGSVSVDGVDHNIVTEIAGTGIAVSHEGGGSPTIRNVIGRGVCKNVVRIAAMTAAIGRVTIDGIGGTSINELVYVSASGANNIDLVNAANITGKSTSAASRSIYMRAAPSGGGVIGKITLNVVDVTNGGYFTSIDLVAGNVATQDIASDGESDTTLAISSATYADTRDTKHRGNTAAYGVLYTNCSNTLTDGVRTNQPTTAGSGVRYNGGSGHLWTNIFVPAGVAPSSSTGGATGVYGGIATTFAGTVRLADNMIRAAGAQWQITGLGAAGWGAGASHAWNVDPLRLGNNYLWVDASGKLRISNGAPTGDTSGTVVGVQA